MRVPPQSLAWQQDYAAATDLIVNLLNAKAIKQLGPQQFKLLGLSA
jgi:hypothetical protein